MQLIFSLISFGLFIALMALAFSFGLAFITVLIVAGFALSLYIVLRGYYLRWKFKDLMEQHSAKMHESDSVVIDAEYKDISESK